MKHPNPDEWIPYVFGEASPTERKRLGLHLQACPDCAQEIASWRRNLRKLDRWQVPKPNLAPRIVFIQPWARWGLAAALVLGIGLLAGRLSISQDTRLTELRSQMEASIRSSLRTELNEALDQFERETSNAVRTAEDRFARVAALENQKTWQSLLQSLERARAEDGQNVRAAFASLQELHESQFVQLRKDLETLASTTDDEIRQARLNLMQLASNTRPD